MSYLPPEKAVLTGTPIRKELFSGNKINGLDFCGFTANKPVIMVMGGSTGSKVINDIVRGMLPTLLRFQVIHLLWKRNLDSKLANLEGYAQFDYIKRIK